MKYTPEARRAMIDRIRVLPSQVEALVTGLSEAELNAHPEGEWTVRQNVHHLADSHMNAYCRVRLALTEATPTIKPYDQEIWADLADAAGAPVADSLAILRGLHARWVTLFRSLEGGAWDRTFFHPEHQREFTVEEMLETYADHGEGHLTQIREALATLAK